MPCPQRGPQSPDLGSSSAPCSSHQVPDGGEASGGRPARDARGRRVPRGLAGWQGARRASGAEAGTGAHGRSEECAARGARQPPLPRALQPRPRRPLAPPRATARVRLAGGGALRDPRGASRAPAGPWCRGLRPRPALVPGWRDSMQMLSFLGDLPIGLPFPFPCPFFLFRFFLLFKFYPFWGLQFLRIEFVFIF
jgi:hypothetical protein